jgi:5-methylcytosine-specific restriction endonuclease McrA
MPSIQRFCLQCNKEFFTFPSQVKRGGGKFCSIGCGTTYRNIHNNPTKDPEVRKKISENHAPVPWLNADPLRNYKGVNVQTYRKKAIRYYGKMCMRCNSTENIHVHHKDRNRKNNELENLEVLCKTCHDLEHLEERKIQQLRDEKTGRFLKRS